MSAGFRWRQSILESTSLDGRRNVQLPFRGAAAAGTRRWRVDNDPKFTESPDGLYDTSEPALSNRLDRFRRRVVESPLDRASFAAMLAVEDLNAAIHLAQSPEQLAEVRDAIEDTIKSLIISLLSKNMIWSVPNLLAGTPCGPPMMSTNGCTKRALLSAFAFTLN